MGDFEAFLRDLRGAVEVDAADLEILAAALEFDPEPAIARAIVGHPYSDERLVDRAATWLLRSESVLLAARRDPSGLEAVIVCRTGLRPTVALDGSALDLDPAAWKPVAEGERIGFRAELAPSAPAWIEVRRGTIVRSVSLAPARTVTKRPSSRKGGVSVIVPIYGGRDATRACLAALARQRSRQAFEVVLVDDASPDADLVAEAAATAAREGWRLLRSRTNLGFAAAVNLGAAAAGGEHLLLLNADAILPPGAIDRLLCAAGEPAVGTVVPFSNDGSFTSFPAMRLSNPVPDEREASRIDAAASRLTPTAVDIAAGTAFCMLVTGPCWDAIDGLDLGYGRGYFEDIDLCLRAERLGFRNVLAPQVYVRHVGSQSFGAARHALIAENARRLVDRFPDYDDAWQAFVEADPLGPLRAEIERHVPPSGPVRLIVGQSARALADELVAGNAGLRALVVEEIAGGCLRLRAQDGGIPQSLRFGVHESGALGRFLADLDVRAVTLADPTPATLEALQASPAWAVPMDVVLAGRASLRLLEDKPDLLRHARLLAVDGMGRATLGLEVDPPPPGVRSTCAMPRVAALVPHPTVDADRLVFGLDRNLSRRGGEVVIFGEAIGRRTRPEATGPMGASEYAAALRHRRITHLLLPDADSPFRLIEDLSHRCALPAAYVDWSQGRYPARPGDLVLDEASSEGERILSIAAWCIPPSTEGMQIP